MTARSHVIAIGAVMVVVVVLLGGLLLVGPARGLLGSDGGALGPPSFVDATATSGLSHTYGGGYEATLGGGLATFDCDDDGLPDLFIAGGDNPAGLFHNDSTAGGDLRFTHIDDPLTEMTQVTGAYPLDIDGDGQVDLAVLRVGGVELLRGLGGCRFEQANARWSFDPPATWVTAFSATWEDSDRLPTLAVGNYVGLDEKGDATYTCPDNLLYRPGASGSGYAAATPLSPGYCTLSMLFSDWNGSGRRDLRISNDRHYYTAAAGGEQLWRIDPGQPPRVYGADDGWVKMQIWGMGIASQDLTGDGLPEVYLTSQGDNKLQTLLSGPGQPTYRDIALKRGVVATHPVNGGDPLPSTAWHPEFADVNNDGLMDLYVSKGNIDQVPDYASKDPSNLYIGQADGNFVEEAAAAGIVNYDHTRGATVVDLNADGLLDLVEVKVNAPVRVWQNVGTGTAAEPRAMGNWLGVRLQQPGGNRDAIGAVIEVAAGDRTLRHETTVGGGHISGELGWVHFGLGPATEARVRVTWPDGEVGPWLTVPANQFLDLARDSGTATPWLPAGS